ncbi:hypothetical protein F2Q70_00031710 [Brassica cretica]|uniref:THH1/TOM1/TOM3 domain-containing protein n=1 Tax=Brassica cretica TaxID=69181 RepID=A0A8S9FH38_BRACR|nr:hypothetical protein F2Q70_00031710 [Brassica cretica]KAF3594138.1 hypothetical protein DY000_02025023 [Brassica cretica]
MEVCAHLACIHVLLSDFDEIRLDSLGAKAELFLMLQRFPVESKGRRKKLQEVKRQ